MRRLLTLLLILWPVVASAQTVRAERAVLGTSVETPIVTATSNVTMSPTGDVIINPTGNDVLPTTNYDINLGSLTQKFLSLHAAELVIENLVVRETQGTIGGRLLVGDTTLLSADLTNVATSITVKHNSLANGDRVRLEANGAVEYLAITSSAGGSAGAYTYSVTRNLDGSGANTWPAGSAVFNTGTTGDGFIDLYSFVGILAGTGPTIVGNVRTGTTYNNIEPRWAIGNLDGLYGYSGTVYGAAFGSPSAAWVKIDPTNGVRLGHNATTSVQIDASGNASFTGAVTAASGAIGGFSLGADFIRDASNSFGLASTATGGNDVRFWAGAAFADRATAPFVVFESGSIAAVQGSIGSWTIGSTYLRSLDADVGMSSAITGGDDVRFWAGDATPTSAEFRVTESGALTASSGAIGGFNLGTDYLRDVANSFGLASTVTGGDDVRFWAGAAFADRATAPYRVHESGLVVARDLVVTSLEITCDGSTVNTNLDIPTNVVRFTTAGSSSCLIGSINAPPTNPATAHGMAHLIWVLNWTGHTLNFLSGHGGSDAEDRFADDADVISDKAFALLYDGAVALWRPMAQ